MVDLVFRAAGQPRTRLCQAHPLLLRALAVTNQTIREILEMQYQFEEPFTVDSTTFTARLGMSATPLNDAVEVTLATYRDTADDGAR